jgi:hypothetical protein
MVFFSRFGYLVAVFFIVAVFIASGLGIAFHLSRESISFLVFLFWGPPCVYYGRTLDHPGKPSTFFGLRLEYWGTYKLQERPLGGLSKSILRKLECQNIGSEASNTKKPLPPISLKAGTQLIREWRGVTQTVLVHADGFEWKGRRYGSLTIIAHKITGAHWSGPRFFGLRKGGRSVEAADDEDAQA